MVSISEQVRERFFREYGVVFDAHVNIIFRCDGRGFARGTYGDFPVMLQTHQHVQELLRTNTTEEVDKCVWELDYPVRTFMGLRCNNTDNLIGGSVCVMPATFLGRCIVKLQRRVRFRIKARYFLCRMLKLFDVDDYSAMHIASFFVTLYPRVV